MCYLILLGYLGASAIAYYTLTTLLATIVGIILVVTARPGHNIALPPKKVGLTNNTKIIDSMLDIIRLVLQSASSIR